jgi:hypothetical protein
MKLWILIRTVESFFKFPIFWLNLREKSQILEKLFFSDEHRQAGRGLLWRDKRWRLGKKIEDKKGGPSRLSFG